MNKATLPQIPVLTPPLPSVVIGLHPDQGRGSTSDSYGDEHVTILRGFREGGRETYGRVTGRPTRQVRFKSRGDRKTGGRG